MNSRGNLVATLLLVGVVAAAGCQQQERTHGSVASPVGVEAPVPPAPQTVPATPQPAVDRHIAELPAGSPALASLPARRNAADPSGDPMPVGNLPGLRQVSTDDFHTDVPLGGFPADVASEWTAYPAPWKDTSRNGSYAPLKVVDISNGVLTEHIRTEAGVPLVTAILPRLHGTNTGSGLTYGRFAVRFRSDSLPGYKIAFLLWPDSGNWPGDGEIDFPELGLASTSLGGYVHHEGATSGDDKAAFLVPTDLSVWHTAVIDWTPGLVVFTLDGVEVGRTTDRVPDTSMHWVLQTETAQVTGPPPVASAGDVQVDWVAAWAYDPSVS